MMEWSTDDGDGFMRSSHLSDCVRYRAENQMKFGDLVGTPNEDRSFTFKKESWRKRMAHKLWLKWYWFRWHLGRRALNIIGMDGEDYCTCDEDY